MIAVNARGYTPLMSAVIAERLDLIKLLISQGADPTFKTKDGDDALTIARLRAGDDPQDQDLQHIVSFLEDVTSGVIQQ